MFRKPERKRHPILAGAVTALTVIGTCRIFTVMKDMCAKMKSCSCKKKTEPKPNLTEE